MSSKKRVGIPSSMNLVSLDNARTWDQVEDICKEVISSIPNLKKYERGLEELGTAKEFFTKEELDQVVLWKHTVGKNRIYNVKYLNANTEQSVQEYSRAAISLAISINIDECLEEDGSLSQNGRKSIQEAMGELGKLKGVGPATASAVLTLVRPDLFCYLYDEVIDCFEPQRDYKISNYLRVNSRCLQIARKLGGGWTPSRVAKTIWTAARFLANNGEDLNTAASDNAPSDAKSSSGAGANGNKGGGGSGVGSGSKGGNNQQHNSAHQREDDEEDEDDEDDEDDEHDEEDEEDEDDEEEDMKPSDAKRQRK